MIEEMIALLLLLLLFRLFTMKSAPSRRVWRASACQNCGGNHPSSPPPLSMGSYARKYAATWGWKPCWGPIPDAYQSESKDE